MMQEEYEKMVGHDVEREHYLDIEFVYVHCPLFGCPDDVRQFVKKKGNEDLLDAMAAIGHAGRVAEERAYTAENRVRDMESHAKTDADTIVNLTRRVTESERSYKSACEQARYLSGQVHDLNRRMSDARALLKEAS